MAQLQALIFDVDGTLAETEEAHREAFNQTFQELGLSWHWGQPLYKKLLDITGGKERIRHYVSHYHTAHAKRLLKGNWVAELHKRKTARYAEMASSGEIALRPGVARLLAEARENGIRLAIATTTNMAPLTALFEGTLGSEAMGWFEAIAAGDMAHNKKPAPDLYELALAKLGVAPAACLALEDSRNGILSSTAAGLATVITKSAYTQDQEFPEAIAVLDNLGEPHIAFKPLDGFAAEPAHVTVDLLRKWHASAYSGDKTPAVSSR